MLIEIVAMISASAVTLIVIIPKVNRRVVQRLDEGLVRATIIAKVLASRVARKTLCFRDENILERRVQAS